MFSNPVVLNTFPPDAHAAIVSNMTEIGSNLTDHLLAAWRQVTDEEEWVLRKVGTVTLQKSGMVPTEGGIRVRDAVEAFIRYTDKPLVASSDAVVQGLSQACKDRVVGIGRGVSTEKLQTKKCGEYVALDRSEEGVWVIPPFAEQATEPLVVGGQTETGSTAVTQNDTSGVGGGTGGGTPVTTVGNPAHAVQGISITGNVPMESWTDIFRCFVNPASKLGLKSLQLGIDFRLMSHDGQPLPADHPAVKAMREAANQLGLRIEGR